MTDTFANLNPVLLFVETFHFASDACPQLKYLLMDCRKKNIGCGSHHTKTAALYRDI